MNQKKSSTNIINSFQLNLNKLIKNPFTNLIGILIGSYLILFAYFGFETIIRISEESENIKDIKLANNYSFGISTFLYVLLTICLINILSVKELGDSNSPLSDLIFKISKNNRLVKVISTIAVGSIFNTIILILLANSRLMSSMYKNNETISNPKLLNFISEVKNNKPKNALLINLLISIIILLFNNNIVKLTSYTNIFLLIVPILVKIIDTINI
jgi:APA family basic amino acid/polyamine antiporter